MIGVWVYFYCLFCFPEQPVDGLEEHLDALVDVLRFVRKICGFEAVIGERGIDVPDVVHDGVQFVIQLAVLPSRFRFVAEGDVEGADFLVADSFQLLLQVRDGGVLPVFHGVGVYRHVRLHAVSFQPFDVRRQ